MFQGEEKRKHARAEFSCKIVIGSAIRLFTIHTENISEGGFRVLLDDKLKPYMYVGLEIFFEKERPIKCKGKVLWVRERLNPIGRETLLYETGIQYVDMSDSDREYIKRIIKALTPQQEDKD